MLHTGQANSGDENGIHRVFLGISRDWVSPGILLQRTRFMRLEETLAQSKAIPGVGRIRGSYINWGSTMDS